MDGIHPPKTLELLDTISLKINGILKCTATTTSFLKLDIRLCQSPPPSPSLLPLFPHNRPAHLMFNANAFPIFQFHLCLANMICNLLETPISFQQNRPSLGFSDSVKKNSSQCRRKVAHLNQLNHKMQIFFPPAYFYSK